ncbi:hypothetical protein ACS0TY_033088 [Phlomoides rotata]
MKGSQKRWQSNSTDSVIGMLMGFDEPPPQRLVPDKSRVLSESYLHKVASISLRPGSSVPIGRSCRTDNDLVDGVKGVSRVRKVLDKCVNSSSRNARSSVRSSEPEHYAGRCVLRRHQKLEHDFVSNSLNFALDMKDKPLPFSSNVSGFKHSRPEYRELGKSLIPEIGKSHHEFSWKELVVKGNVSGHSCVACTRSMRRISPPERHRSKFEDVLKAECTGYGHDPHLDQSSFANKSRKKYFDRGKAVKKVDRFGVSEMPRNLDIRLCTNDSSSSISNLAAQYIHDSSYDSEEAVNAEDFTRINGDPLLKSYPGILLEEGVHSSNVEEIISRETSLNELSEEESAYSKCSGIGPLENLKRTSQHSPNSVLESHDINNPPPFECFDSIGLMLQLQALNFELEEALSEGSAILVSGDEDIEELFGDLSHDGRKIKRWLGDEESRNFSYLVDVLDEAGLYDTNSFMDFNKWASLECPISPLGFDALEKKYGKQASWQKSERLLLFDRINSGLLGIYYPFINFHDGAISFRKKLCSSFRRDEVVEELWTMLISQENGKSKDLSEKALDNWWEFKEGVNIICGELEASLFDELVMELASL